MCAIVQNMAIPDIQNITFGVLNWDEKLGLYKTQLDLMAGQWVSVSIIDAGDEPLAGIERAAQMYQHIQNQEMNIRQTTADALIKNYNENWRDEDEDEEVINAEAFMQRIRLEAISFYGDGSAEVYYDAGDLFLGHTIVASIDEQYRFRGATITG